MRTHSCVQDETLETEHEQYELSYEPVDDKSVLGTHGQKLCENIDAHWLTAVKHGQYIAADIDARVLYRSSSVLLLGLARAKTPLMALTSKGLWCGFMCNKTKLMLR